ncbi:iron ABC transporter permease, partial [Rhizobiaceae sp. 2RAB30]
MILLRTAFLPPDSFPFDSWTFTGQNFVRILSDPEVPSLLLNTAISAFGSIVLGLLFAVWLAWLVERTDMPGRIAI